MIELSFDELKARLFPLVRSTTYRAGLALPLVRAPFLPLLYAHVALEHEGVRRLLVPEDAALFGKTFSELLAIAVGNLALLDHELEAHPDAPGVMRLANDDGLQAARLLLPGFLAKIPELEGAVAAIPNAATLLIAPIADAAAVERLLDLSEAAWREHPAAISPVPYTLADDGAVAELSLSMQHPLRDRLRRAHAELLTHAYGEQRQSLLEAAAERGVDLEVAICAATSHPDFGTVTTTQLIEGLMPLTDLVFVVWHDGDEEHAVLVEREDLHRIAPSRLVPAGDFEPPLFAAVSFPNDHEIAALRAVAVWSAR